MTSVFCLLTRITKKSVHVLDLFSVAYELHEKHKKHDPAVEMQGTHGMHERCYEMRRMHECCHAMPTR